MGKFKVTPETENIHCRVKIGSNPETDGTILRQKSTTKFVVTDGKNTGVCHVSDFNDNSLTTDSMTLSVTKNNGTVVRVKHFNNKFAVDFEDNRYVLTEDVDLGTHESATVVTDKIKSKLKESTKVKKKPKVAKKVAKKIEKKVAKKVAKKTATKSKAKKELVQTDAFEINDEVGFYVATDLE